MRSVSMLTPHLIQKHRWSLRTPGIRRTSENAALFFWKYQGSPDATVPHPS